MTEQQMEFLEKNFPDGCILIFRRPRKTGDPVDAEPVSVYLANPKENEALHQIASHLIDVFNDSLPSEDGEPREDPDQEDDDEDDFGLFK